MIVAQNPKKPVTATYTFPQVGKFKMVCLIHPPDMAMNVVVKPKGAAVPTTEEVAARAQEETRRRLGDGEAARRAEAAGEHDLHGCRERESAAEAGRPCSTSSRT